MIKTLAFVLVLALAACDRAPSQPQADAPAPALKGIDRSHAGQSAPDVEIRDSEDEPATLADAASEPVLVNIGATWCAPGVKELPTLEALGRKAGAPRVIAVSQDIGPRLSVEAFLKQHRLDELEVWHDQEMKLSGALDAQVLPTTIYYDARGREVWRYVGDLDWNGEEAARLLAEAQGGGEPS